MPRLIADDTIEGFKRVGLLPRDKPTPAPVEEKEKPIVVNVTLEQDNSAINKVIELLSNDKPKRLEQWEFVVQRDEDGNMVKILAKQME